MILKKKILLSCLCLLLLVACDPSRNVRKKLYESLNTQATYFVSNGIEVLHYPLKKEVVTVGLFVRGGGANYSAKLEGIEHLAMKTAVQGGSVLYSPLEFQERLEELGATVSAQAGQDYSVVSLRSPSENFGLTWSLFSQAILHPSFNEEFFNKIRNQEIRNVINKSLAPGSAYLRLALQEYFAGQNYAKQPLGTPGSLQSFGAQEAKEFYHALMGKSRLVIVVAGPVSAEEIDERIMQTLGDLPDGYWQASDTLPLPGVESVYTRMEVDRELEEVIGIFSGPLAGSREAVILEVVLQAINDRLDPRGNGLISAGFLPLRLSSGYIRFRGGDLSRKSESVISELNMAYEEGFGTSELEAACALLHTKKGLKAETTAGTMDLGGRAVMEGEWKNFPIFWEELKSIDKKSADKVFRKWFRGLKWYGFFSDDKFNSDILTQFPE